jgi:hypothetical protein
LLKSQPSWYQGFPSPYYKASHVAFRKVVRDFVEKEMKPVSAGTARPAAHTLARC